MIEILTAHLKSIYGNRIFFNIELALNGRCSINEVNSMIDKSLESPFEVKLIEYYYCNPSTFKTDLLNLLDSADKTTLLKEILEHRHELEFFRDY